MIAIDAIFLPRVSVVHENIVVPSLIWTNLSYEKASKMGPCLAGMLGPREVDR
jgi:hypothetical protein